MGANELSTRLWRERELLEALLFRLEEQRLILEAGRSRWVDRASREVEEAIERMRHAGIERAMEVVEVAREWGAPADATLRELIAHAPNEAWSQVFADHLRAMTALAGEVAAVRDANELHLRAALRAAQEAVAGLGVRTGEYGADGTTARADAAPRLLDTDL